MAGIVYWQPMARKIAGLWHRRNRQIPADDLECEVLFGFVHGAPRFDPTRGANLGTYLSWWGMAYARRYVRQVVGRGLTGLSRSSGATDDGAGLRMLRPKFNTTDSRPGTLRDGKAGGPAHSLATIAVARQHYEAGDRDAYLAMCRDDDRPYVEGYYFDGLTMEEVGERHGVSRQRVEQRLKRGLYRIRERLGVPQPKGGRV